MTQKRPSFSTEFKLEAVNLILDKNYSYPEACRAPWNWRDRVAPLGKTTAGRARWYHAKSQGAHTGAAADTGA